MDVLYPCSLCPLTLTTRKHFLLHIRDIHKINPPSDSNDDSEMLSDCSQSSDDLSSEQMHSSYISMQNLTKYISELKMKENSYESKVYSLLKDFLPDQYGYKVYSFADFSFGHFEVKFCIKNMDEKKFIDWLHILSQKSQVTYNMTPYSLQNEQQIVYKCKNIDFWDYETNTLLLNPTECKANVSVAIEHPPNNESEHQSKAFICIKHSHCHPMTNFTSFLHYKVINNVYHQLLRVLQNGFSAADVLLMYKTKIIQIQGKMHYLNLMDSGVKLDVEFLYDIYYNCIKKSSFFTPFIKRVESLMTSIDHYNVTTGKESAILDIVENDIIVAIRTPLMETNSDTIVVCSNSFVNCKTWYMFSESDGDIMTPVGVIIATKDNETMLEAGLNLWKELGGRINTVVVEFIHINTFQLVFPEASICVSKFHLLLGVWKWLFGTTRRNHLNDELNCFVELKQFVCSENFIAEEFLNTNFVINLTKQYPKLKEFMENISNIDFLFYSFLTTNPCTTLTERKLIYHHTKSLSILQMFHFVVNEIDTFYEHLSVDDSNNQKLVFNDFNRNNSIESSFSYSRVGDTCSMYIVENVNDTVFVDMDIGLCLCTISNTFAPCCHQIYLDKLLNGTTVCDSTDICTLSPSNIIVDERQDTEANEFESLLYEFRSVNNRIREEFISDPHYFKTGIQSFVSAFKNNVITKESLFQACHSLNNVDQTDLIKSS